VQASVRHYLPRTSRAFWAAWSLWILTITATAVSMGCGSLAFTVAIATIGALLAWQRTENPIGWLLSGTAMCSAAAGVGLMLAHFPDTARLGQWLGFAWLLGLGLAALVLLLFPTGSLPSRRWRPVAMAAVAGNVCWVLGNAFAPTIITASPASLPNPIGLPAPAGRFFDVLAIGGVALIVLSGVAAALRNIASFAPGASTRIWLAHCDDALRFEVSDDGPGFDQASRVPASGLQNMADRVSALGGDITIASQPGEGTTISGRIPLPADGAGGAG
jgi:hypothetical protein